MSQMLMAIPACPAGEVFQGRLEHVNPREAAGK